MIDAINKISSNFVYIHRGLYHKVTKYDLIVPALRDSLIGTSNERYLRYLTWWYLLPTLLGCRGALLFPIR